MSNTLLESLWSRVSANIGDRIDQINELLTQALSANTESIAAHEYVDNAVITAPRSPRVLLHYGTGDPALSSFSDARVGDIVERVSDGSRWRVDS